jgi:hypothetical protein
VNPLVAARLWRQTGVVIESTREALIVEAVGEVDQSLLHWYRELSIVERLRAASRSAATLERLARAASSNR